MEIFRQSSFIDISSDLYRPLSEKHRIKVVWRFMNIFDSTSFSIIYFFPVYLLWFFKKLHCLRCNLWESVFFSARTMSLSSIYTKLKWNYKSSGYFADGTICCIYNTKRDNSNIFNWFEIKSTSNFHFTLPWNEHYTN